MSERSPNPGRVIRRIEDPPFPGALITFGNHSAVRISSVELAGWEGWRYSGAEHIAAPLDVIATTEGHDAVVPWCVRKLAVFLAQRDGVGSLPTGELVTILVSVLRANADLADDVGVQQGTWWITDQGRPLFVCGGGETALEYAVTLFQSVGEDTVDRALRRVVEGIGKELRNPRSVMRQLDAWEDELLDLASPQPLRLEPFRATSGAIRTPGDRAVLTRRDARSGQRHSPRQRSRGVPVSLWAAVAELGRRFAAVLPSRRERKSPPGKSLISDAESSGTTSRWRRPMIVGAALATVAIALGVLWPFDDSPHAESARGEELGVNGPPTDDESGVTEADLAIPEDRAEPVSDAALDSPDVLPAISGIQHVVLTCPDASGVCASLLAPGSEINWDIARGLLDGATVSLVDDYGDIAVLRASTATTEGYVVMIRLNEKWLLRDIYDVATTTSP